MTDSNIIELVAKRRSRELTPDEIEILEGYRRMTPYDRARYLQYLERLARAHPAG